MFPSQKRVTAYALLLRLPTQQGAARLSQRGTQGAPRQNRGQEMKHPSNRELFEYWNLRRGERLPPERSDIDPGAIRKILGDTFVLEMSGINNPVFRLAGTRLCALFARELK